MKLSFYETKNNSDPSQQANHFPSSRAKIQCYLNLRFSGTHYDAGWKGEKKERGAKKKFLIQLLKMHLCQGSRW